MVVRNDAVPAAVLMITTLLSETAITTVTGAPLDSKKHSMETDDAIRIARDIPEKFFLKSPLEQTRQLASAVQQPDFVLQVDLANTTAVFYAFREPRDDDVTGDKRAYDGKGAMYFAVAVILIYGISIALMIGTTLRKSDDDYEVKGFLRSYARLDQQRRSSEKHKVRQVLIAKNLLPMLPGCSLAAAPGLFNPGAGSAAGKGKGRRAPGNPGVARVASIEGISKSDDRTGSPAEGLRCEGGDSITTLNTTDSDGLGSIVEIEETTTSEGYTTSTCV